MRNVLRIVCLLSIASFLPTAKAAPPSSYDLRSPDKRIEVRIRTAEGVRYDVVLNGRAILEDSSLSINVEHKTFGKDASQVIHSKESSHDEVIEPAVRQKFAKIRDHYNEVRLEMDGGYAVTFRVYNEGVAYRFETSLPQQEVKDVYKRQVPSRFPCGTPWPASL